MAARARAELDSLGERVEDAVTIDSLAIWTVGHSTRTIEEFPDILLTHQIRFLVDVRRFPGSRRLPQFNAAALQHALAASGIRYEHLVELGGRRRVRPDSRHDLTRHKDFTPSARRSV